MNSANKELNWIELNYAGGPVRGPALFTQSSLLSKQGKPRQEEELKMGKHQIATRI